MEIFSKNKEKIREMNFKIINNLFIFKGDKLSYLGLPSSEMGDILSWKNVIGHISAVERGIKGQEYIRQHNIYLMAFKKGLQNILTLYRGEIDDILIKGYDLDNKKLKYPYDIINLDYTGGLIYKNGSNNSKRFNSIKQLFKEQSEKKQTFILIITCNTDNEIEKEYNYIMEKVISSNSTLNDELIKRKKSADKIDKLKIVILTLIRDLSKSDFSCKIYKPIFYEGNKNTLMVNFSFLIEFKNTGIMEKKIKYTDIDIINFQMFKCENSNISDYKT